MENKKEIKDIRIGYPDCCFSADDNLFRYRTGAIIIEDGCFLVVKSETSSYFYTVGGGVHMNEKSEECISAAEEIQISFMQYSRLILNLKKERSL